MLSLVETYFSEDKRQLSDVLGGETQTRKFRKKHTTLSKADLDSKGRYQVKLTIDIF